MQNTIRLVIGGDVAPIRKNEALFQQRARDAIFGHLAESLESADLTIFNLECPLTEARVKQRKLGVNLKASPGCIRGMPAAKHTLVNLANNHIMDYGDAGLSETISVLSQAGFATIGARTGASKVGEPFVKTIAGVRIAVVSYTDPEFSVLGMASSTAGANPFDWPQAIVDITGLRGQSDLIVVLLHRGYEGYDLPSPSLQNTCRALIELGANAVVCQQSHVAGALEEHKEGLIVYGQGNLIFAARKYCDAWHRGLLVELEFSLIERRLKYRLVPYQQDFEHGGIAGKADQTDAEFLERFLQRSACVRDLSFVRSSWDEFVGRQKAAYMFRYQFPWLALGNRYLVFLARRLAALSPAFPHSRSWAMWNLLALQSEDHREVACGLFRRLWR
jgi:hypothetical protein